MADSSVVQGEQDRSSKVSIQLKRLTEANAKYKNLLKLAKERIQQQEEELERIQSEKRALEDRVSENGQRDESAKEVYLDGDADRPSDDVALSVVRVCQRVRVGQASNDGKEEIWALMEMEAVPLSDVDVANTRRFREWKRFETDAELQDYIRRDTGEPLNLPHFSLSPEQSLAIQKESNVQVSKVTEEFRRFRVKAELSRKQMEAQIRELQSTNFHSAARRIEVRDSQYESDQIRSLTSQLDKATAELASLSRLKEANEALTAEISSLRSSGSETMLAAQWRQRYETCLQEKRALEERLNSQSSSGGNDYEAKYRDLKESFRLYRKKAKEIFEAQERGAVPPLNEMDALNIADASSAEAKLSYLKNLMVNYLSTDLAVRDHMESAIGTVLQFSPEEMDRIHARKKAASDAWF
jgi:GRIP domain